MMSRAVAEPCWTFQMSNISWKVEVTLRMWKNAKKRSPIPSPLLLLGWCSWSAMLPSLRAGLLLRAHSGLPSMLTLLCKFGPQCEGTWYYQASLDLRGVTGSEGIPPIRDHHKLLRASLTRARELDWARLVRAAEAHSNLCHFPVLLANRLGAGSCLAGEFTSPRVPLSTSLLVMRLWSGGQGLRGGDRARVGPPLTRSLCAFCGGFGGEVPEDLQHFLWNVHLQRHLHSSVKQLLLEPWNHRVGKQSHRTQAMAVIAQMWQVRKAWIRQQNKWCLFHSTSLANYECMDQIQVPWTAKGVEKSLIECIMLLALAIKKIK